MAIRNALTYEISTAPSSTFPPTVWTVDDTLELQTLSRRIAPGISQADFKREYGVMIDGTVRAANSYAGQYVKIKLTDTNTTPDTTWEWWGYVVTPADVPEGAVSDGSTDRPSGVQQIVVHDISHYLSLEKINMSLTDSGQVSRVISLNVHTEGRRDGSAGNYILDGSSHRIASKVGAGTRWNAYTALLYWRDLVGTQLGISLTLNAPAGFDTALGNIDGVWSWEGESFWSALMSIINPERGYICYLVGDNLYVDSTVSTAIQDAASNTLVPASGNQTSFGADVLPYGKNPSIKHLEELHFDQIEVRGRPIRVTFTMSSQLGTLESGWLPADESTMDSAGSEAIRRRALRDVFRRFVIPAAWAGEDAASNNLIPVANTSGGVDWTTQQSHYFHDWQIEDQVPIDSDKLLPIQVWINDDGTYYDVTDNSQRVNSTVSALDDGIGFRLTPPNPLTFGDGHYGGSESGTKWDWWQIYATVSVYTNQYMRVLLTSTAAEPGPITRTKVIDVSYAELWVIAKGTVTEAYDTTLTTQADNATLRDDSAILDAIGRIAGAYYGTRKAVIDNAYEVGIILENRLGNLVVSSSYGGSAVPVGTVINEITHQFGERQSTRFRTEILQPDFVKWFAPTMSRAAVRRRLSAAATQSQNSVSNPAAIASSSPSYWVKITGAITLPDVYLGDVWFNGYYDDQGAVKTPDLTGKTIKIIKTAAGSDWSDSELVTQAILSADGIYEIEVTDPVPAAGYWVEITGAASPPAFNKYVGKVWLNGYYDDQGAVKPPDLLGQDIFIVQTNSSSDWSNSGLVRNAVLSEEGHYEIDAPIATAVS